MNYEFYADVFFLSNFYLDFLAVYLTSEILQQKKKLLRYLLCSAVSSVIGCVLFLVITDYDLYLLCIHFIVNPGMVIGCFFPAGKRIYGKAFGLMYFTILLSGGSVEWLYHTIAGGRYYELCLLSSAVPVEVFLYILRQRRKKVHCFYQVSVEYQGKTLDVQALYDTGNNLIDPYVRQPVHIISRNVYKMLIEQEQAAIRLVPFSSVGCKNGILEVFTVEKIKIKWDEKEIELAPAVLAAADDRLFEHRPYQMILNRCVGGKMGRKEEEICI